MTVFISRTLQSDSIFLQSLRAKGFQIIDFSLLEFSALPFTPPVACDWIFFYSSNAVAYFFSAPNMGSTFLPEVQIAAMGKGTAQTLVSFQRNAHFIGEGSPKKIAQDFLQLASGKQVLFPRALQSRQSIQTLLGNQIESIDLPVYQNEGRKDWTVPKADIFVFTSPLNVKTFFSKAAYDPQMRIVAIGKTTAKALSMLGIEAFLIAEEATEEGLYKAVIAIRNNL